MFLNQVKMFYYPKSDGIWESFISNKNYFFGKSALISLVYSIIYNIIGQQLSAINRSVST